MEIQLHKKKLLRFLVLLISLVSLISPSLALQHSDFKAELVTYVHSYDRFIPRWSNVYNPGETIELYAGIENVNRGRAAAVDFVMITKDPNDYVVEGKVVNIRETGYLDEFYEVFSIPIPNAWIDGGYKLEVYVFDVLNPNATYRSYVELYNKILYQGEYEVSLATISREYAPCLRREILFMLDSKADTAPPTQFLVFDSRLKAKEVPEGVPNFLIVSALNTIEKEGSFELELRVNGKVVDRQGAMLGGYEVKTISLEMPPLPIGDHLVEVFAIGKVSFTRTLPIFIPPLLYHESILVGRIANGSVVYSPNNYVLGSIGISEIKEVEVSKAIAKLKSKQYDVNKESAKKMLTNILAYLWKENNRAGTIRIALIKGSDTRAEEVLPVLLELIKEESRAPINYLGIKDYNELADVSVAFYVGSEAPKVERLDNFFRKGGFLIVDDTAYWLKMKDGLEEKLGMVKGWRGFKSPEGIFYSYYDLSIDKWIRVRERVEIPIPLELKYSDLRISKLAVSAGEPVEISFKVKNEGGRGKDVIKVLVNKEVVFEREVEFKAGEEKEISFRYVPEEVGSYKVEIPGTDLIKVFFAKVKKEEIVVVTPPPERKGAELVVGFAALLAVLVIARMLMR